LLETSRQRLFVSPERDEETIWTSPQFPASPGVPFQFWCGIDANLVIHCRHINVIGLIGRQMSQLDVFSMGDEQWIFGTAFLGNTAVS